MATRRSAPQRPEPPLIHHPILLQSATLLSSLVALYLLLLPLLFSLHPAPPTLLPKPHSFKPGSSSVFPSHRSLHFQSIIPLIKSQQQSDPSSLPYSSMIAMLSYSLSLENLTSRSLGTPQYPLQLPRFNHLSDSTIFRLFSVVVAHSQTM